MKLRFLSFLVLTLLCLSCKKSITIEDIISPEALHDRAVGASAKELLSPSRYKSLNVEVQYMTGFAPDASALNALKDFLVTYLHKPGGITIMTKEIRPSTSAALSSDDIISIERAN